MRALAISDHFMANAALSALVGGLLLGATVAFKAGVVGEVLGVSGSTRGLLAQPSPGKLAFILGLITAGVAMSRSYGGTEPMPLEGLSDRQSALVYVRMGFGGLLVGFGTALGNGCTSGHGLTGLARLTLRSWVAVPIFMATGILTATLSGTSGALPPNAASEADVPKWYAGAAVAACVAVFLVGCAAASPTAARLLGEERAWRAKPLAEYLSGLAFGCGLMISSMARPSKVAAFLDLGSGAWDPSLAFVMGGGLFVTFPFYQLLERRTAGGALLGGPLNLVSRMKPVDRGLVVGAILFGVGWGTCGACPGPLWVLVGARPSLEVLTCMLGLLLGMGVWVAWPWKKCAAAAGGGRDAARVVDIAGSEYVGDEMEKDQTGEIEDLPGKNHSCSMDP